MEKFCATETTASLFGDVANPSCCWRKTCCHDRLALSSCCWPSSCNNNNNTRGERISRLFVASFMCQSQGDGCQEGSASSSTASLSPCSPTKVQDVFPTFASPPSYDVSEANTILYLRGCMAWTIEFSPAVQPHTWLVINLLCCGASVTVLLDVLLSLHKVRAQVIAEELFLVYNCTSTAIWCLQTILTILYRRASERCLNWPIRLEVCLALFFFYGSVQLISAWHVHDDDVARQDLRSSLFNTFAYLYVSYELWMRVLEQSSRPDGTIIGLDFYNRMDSDATLKQTNRSELPEAVWLHHYAWCPWMWYEKKKCSLLEWRSPRWSCLVRPPLDQWFSSPVGNISHCVWYFRFKEFAWSMTIHTIRRLIQNKSQENVFCILGVRIMHAAVMLDLSTPTQIIAQYKDSRSTSEILLFHDERYM